MSLKIFTALCVCLAMPGAIAGASAQAAPHAASASSAPGEGETLSAAQRAYAEQLAGRLAGTGDARGLAFAAWLRDSHRTMAQSDAMASEPDVQARAWRALAFQRAGTDPVALALLSSAPEGDPVSAQARARWRQLEPTNLVPVLLAEVDGPALIAAAGAARSANSHAIAQLRWIVDAVRRHPPDAALLAALVPEAYGLDGLAVPTGWSYLAGYAMPAYGPLIDACRNAAAGDMQACRNASSVLQGGDTRLAEAIGLSLARDLAPTRAARREAEAARHRFDWQMFEIGHLSGRAPEQQLREYVQLLAVPGLETEAALNLEQLRLAGVPLDPPPGWRPPR